MRVEAGYCEKVEYLQKGKEMVAMRLSGTPVDDTPVPEDT